MLTFKRIYIKLVKYFLLIVKYIFFLHVIKDQNHFKTRKN